MSNSNSILFVGPLPPPVHGFAEINRRMLLRLQSISSVLVFNVTPIKSVGFFYQLKPWVNLLLLILKYFYVSFTTKHWVLYLPLSGGFRQLIDLCFALPALLLGKNIYVHHHSFSYINRRPLFARFVLSLLRNTTHIVLGETMATRLKQQYPVIKGRFITISNVAFLDDIQAPECANKHGKLVLGFLSNITREKGIFDFLALIEETSCLGLPVEGIIAGPVNDDVKVEVESALEKIPAAKYIGPVYGVIKTGYFQQIDLLIFPTRYENEAEPVTIWEALGSGVPVIALSRGCIADVVIPDIGLTIFNQSKFIEQAIEHISYLIEQPNRLADMQLNARSYFLVSRAHHRKNLEALLEEIIHNAT